jgi:hypothetical protein
MLLASDFDKSKYFKADEVDEEEGEISLKIKAAFADFIGNGATREKKLILSFQGEDKMLILNKINNRALRGAYGDDADAWVGKSIILFRTTAEMAGKMVPAIRVRIPTPKTPKPAKPPLPPIGEDMNDEIPI